MSRFYGSLQGNRGHPTRQGTPKSGISPRIKYVKKGVFLSLFSGVFFFLFIFFCKPVKADTDLIDLIPSLYGGDGVQLRIIGGHAPHFEADALTELSQLATAASEIAFPIPSSQGGFTFEFDPLLNEFVKSSDSLGPIFAERPQTVGKNKLNLGFSYTFIDFTRFDSEDLDDLSVTFTHRDTDGDGPDLPSIGAPPGYKFERDIVVSDLSIELKSHVVSFYGTYGITDNIDIGFLIPVIRNEMKVSAAARVIEDSSKINFAPTLHAFDPLGIDGDAPIDSVEEEKTGIGDIILRTKYNVLNKPRIKLSLALEVRLPTGEDANLMGIARLGLKPLLILSSSIPVWEGTLNPHLNIGYEVNAGAKGQDEIDYIVGFDYGREVYGDMATIAVDLIGSHETQKRDNIGDDIVDASVGIKCSFYEQTLLYVNVQFPLNDQGLRADVITTVGCEIGLR
jgi:hypothetical protein